LKNFSKTPKNKKIKKSKLATKPNKKIFKKKDTSIKSKSNPYLLRRKANNAFFALIRKLYRLLQKANNALLPTKPDLKKKKRKKLTKFQISVLRKAHTEKNIKGLKESIV